METEEYRRNYDLERSYWWFAGVRAMVRHLLAASGAPGRLGRVLDVGCGTGALIDELKARADSIRGVDFSPEALRFCARRGLKCVALADAREVPFPDASFDVVTAIGLIEHLEDDESFILEMHRLLRPGGLLVLLTSSFPWLWSMHDVANQHHRRYYLRPLRSRVESAGFETVRFSHMNFLLFPLLAPAIIAHRWIVGLTSAHPRRILPQPPKWVNAALTGVLRIEAVLMRRLTLPWGVSMIGAFRRHEEGAASARSIESGGEDGIRTRGRGINPTAV